MVDNLNVDLLEAVGKFGLIHALLHRVHVQGQCLILSCDRTPEVEKLAERVLLEAGQRDRLFVRLLYVLVDLLAIVRDGEELGNLCPSPNCLDILSNRRLITALTRSSSVTITSTAMMIITLLWIASTSP